ncbi:MAG: tetratricopeptide repeat protein [Candidatus Hydrogenedentes bacterium]|nr:tetratricopeptide repeat protein [Candidatus Hydrogenedentota bacterium]
MRSLAIGLCALLIGLGVAGCTTTGGGDQLSNTVYATYKIAKNLEQDLGPSVTKLNQTAADLTAKVEANDMAVKSLQSAIEDNQAKLDSMQKSIDKLSQDVYRMSGRPTGATGLDAYSGTNYSAQSAEILPPPGGAVAAAQGTTPVPSPESVPGTAPAGTEVGSNALTDYNAAQRSFYGEDFETALAQYSAYLQKYPDSKYSDGAQYWKADCLRKLNRLEEAIAEYEKLRTTYPNSPKVSMSLSNQADAHLRLGQTQRAVALLKQLVDNYPNAPEVELAKKRLKELQGN